MALALPINPKVNETTIQVRDHEADLNLGSHSVKTINDLPPEVLEELFNYMTFTGKLICRVVCQKWNAQISSTLLKTAYYSLGSEESCQDLLDSHDSGMEWKNLRIPNFPDTGFILPSKFKDSIIALNVHFPNCIKSQIREYIKFLSGFPNLKTLKVSIDGGPDDKECGVQTDTQRQFLEKTMGIYAKLKILSIRFPFNSYTVLCEFLSETGLNGSLPLTLDSLSIAEESPTEAERVKDRIYRIHTERIPSVFLPVLYTIRDAAKTVKSLALDVSSMTIQRVFIIGVLPRLSRLSKREILKLENVLIQCIPNERNINKYFSALQEFVKTQAEKGKLKSVILPWCPNAALCQEFLKSLPRDIEFVGNVQNEHLSPEFPSQFKHLKSLCIESNLTKDIFNVDQASIRRVEFDLRKCRVFNPVSFAGNMCDYLHNLTEIQVVGNDVLIFDSDLRDIIMSLGSHLRVLHLESLKITDYGVLDLEEGHRGLQELIQTRRIYIPRCSKDNSLEIFYPLSSMKKLEKLVLVGTSITDAGIILGFKFGKHLKELTLGSQSQEITDFGLYSLGSNNPGLEAFHGSFQSRKISTVGIEKLKTQLLLTQSTRKFKVINEKPRE